ARAPPVRADRRDRAAPPGERRQDRPRDRALPGRPRDRAPARARARAPRPLGAPLDRRRRRPRLGARPQRALRRGAPVLAPRAAARNAGRAQVLPPRIHRAVSGARACRRDVAPTGALAQPALLAAVGAGCQAVGRVKRLTILVGVLTIALLAPLAAKAHPLGNFTINTFSRVQVSGDRVYVRYVLDLAEIPTFQAGRIDAHSYARRIARGARLGVDGHAASLAPLRVALAHPAGAGGLRTTRLEVILRGPSIDGRARITYRDTNYAGRLGWREVVVGASTKSRSDELRAYPKDLLSSPLHVTSVAASLAPTSDPVPSLTRGRALQAPDRVADGGFASLIRRDHLSAGFVLLSLLVAMFWGAAHALSPGHGKSIVAAYLVGSRGTARHALFL